MQKDAAYWINRLKLKEHTEGGWFCETYRSKLLLDREALSEAHSGDRAAMTAIWFLLNGDEKSHFHRLCSDELWFFQVGRPLNVYIINFEGVLQCIRIGEGHCLQAVIPANHWFAAELQDKQSFALVSCVVAPGFDFNDFELANRQKLLGQYPQHQDLIKRLTYNAIR